LPWDTYFPTLRSPEAQAEVVQKFGSAPEGKMSEDIAGRSWLSEGENDE